MRRARKIIEEKNPDLSEDEKSDIAEKIGIGAVKYADLSQFRTTITFSCGTRCFRYTGTPRRICRMHMFESARFSVRLTSRPAQSGRIPARRQSAVATNIDKLVLIEPAELDLAKRVCQFAEIVPQVLNGFRPNILANYLFELANSFHSFYEACPVLKSQEPARASRLALCELTGRVLQKGLELMGIRAPEKM